MQTFPRHVSGTVYIICSLQVHVHMITCLYFFQERSDLWAKQTKEGMNRSQAFQFTGVRAYSCVPIFLPGTLGQESLGGMYRKMCKRNNKARADDVISILKSLSACAGCLHTFASMCLPRSSSLPERCSHRQFQHQSVCGVNGMP